jgi:hypothetical protein
VLDIEPPFQLLECIPSFAPTREDIDRRVAVFRPGMDGHVGFSEQDDTGHPIGRELVYFEVYDGEVASSASSKKTLPNNIGIVDELRVFYPKLSNEMFPKNNLLFHSMDILPREPRSLVVVTRSSKPALRSTARVVTARISTSPNKTSSRASDLEKVRFGAHEALERLLTPLPYGGRSILLYAKSSRPAT